MHGQHDLAHLVLRLCARHGIHLTGHASHYEVRSFPHVRLARVPRGEALSRLHVHHARVHHGEVRFILHVRPVRVLLHVRGVRLLAGLRLLVRHGLRVTVVLLVARLAGDLLPPHVRVVSINTGFDISWKFCKLEFLFGLKKREKVLTRLIFCLDSVALFSSSG